MMLRWALLLALLVGVLLLVFLWVEPGPLSIDEVTYQRMTHDLLAGHGLFLWNGYEELPSVELELSSPGPPSVSPHPAAIVPMSQKRVIGLGMVRMTAPAPTIPNSPHERRRGG